MNTNFIKHKTIYSAYSLITYNNYLFSFFFLKIRQKPGSFSCFDNKKDMMSLTRNCFNLCPLKQVHNYILLGG